jgi:hypothetical protein
MVLRSVIGTERDEVTGEWRRLLNEERCDLYSSADIIRVTKSRRLRWAGHVARMWGRIGAYRVLVGKPEGRRPLGISSPRWGIILKWISMTVGGGGSMGWMDLDQVRGRWRGVVNAVMNVWVYKMLGIS